MICAVGTGKEMILAAERDRTHGALDDIGIDLDAAFSRNPDEYRWRTVHSIGFQSWRPIWWAVR
jgi:hypothetical protein